MTEPENPSTSSREEALFQAAAAQPAAQRAAFLDRECAGDPALRARLAALLAAYEQTGTLFGTAAAENARHALALGPARELAEDAVGQDLGRYRLLEKLGEGGCGVVYLAEQTEGVRRRVALKLIKLGLDTREVIARFEAELQALALMDHPNIAKVLDAGVMGQRSAVNSQRSAIGERRAGDDAVPTLTSEVCPLTSGSGRPYFVMELVRGIRITDYCDQNQLSTRGRLDLFIKVCQAIQHAHQKGIIHRDIKPSNILVAVQDGEPVPKVIDFGIAKAIEGRLTDATVYTRLHQFIGTPAYMSPEQAELSGLDVDTRSDIYSLGVLLYELLTGTTPFDPRQLLSQGIDAMRRTIREKEPVRPSTRLTQELARLESGSAPAPPATSLSPGSAPASGAAVGAPPTASSPGSRANELGPRSYAGADSRGRKPATPGAGALPNESKPTGPQAGAAPAVEGPQRVRLREWIRLVRGDLDWIVMKCLEKDRARRYATANGLAADLQRHLNHEPVVARPPSTTYRFQKAWRRNRLAFTGAAFLGLALVGGALFSRWQTGRALEAEAVAREARADAEAIVAFLVEVFSRPDPSRDGRDVTIAETLDRAAVRLEHDLRERPHRRAVLQGAVAETYRALGLYREAIPLLEQVLHHATATHGQEHSNTVREMGRLAESYGYVGRDRDAAQLLEGVLAWQRRTKGLGHSDTHRAADLLASAYEGMGLPAEALRLRHEATEAYRRTGGAMNRNVLGALRRQARLHATLGQREAATSRFEELVALSQATLGPEDRETIWAMAELGLAYADRGMHEEALYVREDVIELSCRILGPDHTDTLHAMHRLADSQEAIGRRPDALRLREDVVKQMRRLLGVEHRYTLQAMTSLALTHRASAGGLDAAIGLLEEVVTVRQRHQGARHRETLLAMHLLAGCYLDRGRAEDAVRQGEEVASLRREVLGPDDPETLWSIAALGEFYAEARRFREAFERLHEVLERRCQNLGGDHPDTLLAADRLSLARQLAFCEGASDRGSPSPP